MADPHPLPEPEAQARFAAAVMASPDALLVVDGEGRLLELNPAAAEMLRCPQADAVGRDVLELIVAPAKRTRHPARFARNGAPVPPTEDLARRTEVMVMRGDGTEFPAEFSLSRLAGAPPAAFAVHLRDITERKLAEAGLAAMQVDLEMRFAERAEALSTANLELEREIAEGRRRERLQNATYRISEAALDSADLAALFEQVHNILAELMPANNCYVAILSADGSELSFPRFVDEMASPPAPRKPGRGLTEYLLDTGKPLIVTDDEMEKLMRAAGYAPIGLRCKVWIGAPLMVSGRAIGAIALQDYRTADAYTEEDLRLLTFVAEQLAAAVQRKQTDDARRKAEEAYRSMFENAPEGLYQSTPDGRFLRVNRAFARIFGYVSPGEVLAATENIGKQIYVDPRRRDAFFELVRNTDEIADFESEVYRRNGEKVWISESVRVLRTADGAVRALEGVAIDITEQRRAAAALREAKEVADAANRAKSQFLASMSHELRTPLNGILGYTQILRRDGSLTARQSHGVSVIHHSAEHLLALINDVLDLSKIEARRLQINTGDFDLVEFAHGIGEMFLPRAREKSLRFATEFAPGLPRGVQGDEQRLRQVLLNLIGNAIKFTHEGAVVFSIRAGETGRLRFSVSDSGTGIAPQDLGRLFEPFTQLGDSRLQAAGTGLGLAISRSLVELMGGTLQVDSRPGFGSCFWFELPLAPASAPVGRSRRAQKRIRDYQGERRRILVVDDNSANRDVLLDLLRGVGFIVESAETGEEALDRIGHFPADVVLMDLRMPGMGGLEATRELRRRIGNRIAIVAVSASAYDLDRRECLDAGCNDFLPKPLSEDALWDVLERLLTLTWCFDEPAGKIASAEAVPHQKAVLPAEEADAIHELASAGDVMGIRARVSALAERDPQMAGLATAIIELADSYRMKAIRQYVAPWRSTD